MLDDIREPYKQDRSEAGSNYWKCIIRSPFIHPKWWGRELEVWYLWLAAPPGSAAQTAAGESEDSPITECGKSGPG